MIFSMVKVLLLLRKPITYLKTLIIRLSKALSYKCIQKKRRKKMISWNCANNFTVSFVKNLKLSSLRSAFIKTLIFVARLKSMIISSEVVFKAEICQTDKCINLHYINVLTKSA